MKIYNSLTRKKELFQPLEANRVGMYVCGVTVYDDCHLGHARSAVAFDVLRRYLMYRGYQVTYVRNFTDIDDKIINKANQKDLPWQEIVNTYIDAYYRDMNRLHVTIPDVEPRATEHMPEIIEMIENLIDKGFAYRVDGDVYYEVAAYQAYGRLSGRKEEELLAGARVEVDERKRNPMDFALWKSSKPGEPGWESPWGKGRPGWHIECSAMSIRHLGKTFDIHGGGKDLVFPHHENEIAQSCAYSGQEFANYWVHNGFITIDEEKMSKSLGNFFTIQEIFEKSEWSESVSAEIVRYFLLSTHYRSDMNFSDQALSEAKSALNNLYELFQKLETQGEISQSTDSQILETSLKEFEVRFEQAMDDDLNTPKALAEFQRLRGDINKMMSTGLSDQNKKVILKKYWKIGGLLGLFECPPNTWQFEPPIKENVIDRVNIEDWANQQIQKRQEARERKDFAEADKIRQELASKGIILEDGPDGTTRWKR